MSALDGWIDICRVGTWRDTAGREVAIDEGHLDRIVAAHAGADPTPVVVGHPEVDGPAFAWVDGLRRTGDRLQATLRDIAPAFREAVEAGRYAGRSIALQGDTLRHLGFLGGRAPAVPGLAPTQFAGEADTVINFAAAERRDGSTALAAWSDRRVLHAIARTLRGVRDRIIATDGVEAADKAIDEFDLETITEAANEPAETDAARPIMAAPDPMQPQADDRSRRQRTGGPSAAREDRNQTRPRSLPGAWSSTSARRRSPPARPRWQGRRPARQGRRGARAAHRSRANPARGARRARGPARVSARTATMTCSPSPGRTARPRCARRRARCWSATSPACPSKSSSTRSPAARRPERRQEDSPAIASEARALMAAEAEKGVEIAFVRRSRRSGARRARPADGEERTHESRSRMWQAADAGAAIKPHRVVKYGDADGKVIQSAAAGDFSHRRLGAAPTLPAAGASRSPATGIADVEYGGAVARGALLSADANGKAVVARLRRWKPRHRQWPR